MQVLYISQKPAFPIVDGGSFAINRLLLDLNELVDIEIDYLAITTKKHPLSWESIPSKIAKNITIHTVELNTSIKILPLLSSFFSALPYNLLRYKQKEFIGKIKELALSKNYNFILLDGFYTTAYLHELRTLTDAKIIYRSHNIENQIWSELAGITANKWKRIFLNILAKKVKKYEGKIHETVDTIAAICQTDADYFKSFAPSKVQVIPVSILPVKPATTITNNELCFIGNFNWFPNVEGISWFIDNVFSTLKNEYPKITLHIAGFGSRESLAAYNNKGIVIHGAIDDVPTFIKSHGIFISPIFYGSGIKIKVLEAMNASVPVVLSQKSAEGINFPNTSSFFITKEEAHTQLKTLLDNPAENDANRLLMSHIIKTQFTQDIVIDKLKSILHE
jgi:glycosyltransferase involved in cell wall biosynthesis